MGVLVTKSFRMLWGDQSTLSQGLHSVKTPVRALPSHAVPEEEEMARRSQVQLHRLSEEPQQGLEVLLQGWDRESAKKNKTRAHLSEGGVKERTKKNNK